MLSFEKPQRKPGQLWMLCDNPDETYLLLEEFSDSGQAWWRVSFVTSMMKVYTWREDTLRDDTLLQDVA
jgi:hypothetical protein